jgi:Putative prokaryotic signal transducing protein
MDWITVLKTKNTIEAEMCKAKLIENGINAIILDKKDSNYPVLGEIEVMVLAQDLKQAQSIINVVHA